MDFTPIVDALAPLAYAAVVAAIPILVPAILKRLRISNNADLVNAVLRACDAGAGAAYKFAMSHEQGLSNVDVHNAALSVGAAYVANGLPDTLKKLGVTPEWVRSMVSARLGTLLAADPNVSVVATPATLPAVEGPLAPLPA